MRDHLYVVTVDAVCVGIFDTIEAAYEQARAEVTSSCYFVETSPILTVHKSPRITIQRTPYYSEKLPRIE